VDPDTGEDQEPCFLVAVIPTDTTDNVAEETLDELAALASTAGARVVGRAVQKRSSLDPAILLGKGKLDEVSRDVSAAGATLVIFSNELTIGQQDRLASALDARVIDRRALILDIFAQHAHTREGATQVELAQLTYLLPRIRGRGIEMSRMGGGIGTRRGPGETKLEVDRRRIRKRIRKLESELSRMEAVRGTQRKLRVRAGLPSVCLVGYTNSGKSSLLNALTGSSELVEDRLFSTLDSATRRILLPNGQAAVLSDTVGFIRNLPHELVASFRSTLEVVREADLLVHVADAAREEGMPERIKAVEGVLAEIGADGIPRVLALNKIDLVEPADVTRLGRAFEDAHLVSAVSGAGIEELLDAVLRDAGTTEALILEIPASRGDLISELYRAGNVRAREYRGDTAVLTVELPAEKRARFERYQARAREPRQ
jgi:GTP-binding protein HflX